MSSAGATAALEISRPAAPMAISQGHPPAPPVSVPFLRRSASFSSDAFCLASSLAFTHAAKVCGAAEQCDGG